MDDPLKGVGKETWRAAIQARKQLRAIGDPLLSAAEMAAGLPDTSAIGAAAARTIGDLKRLCIIPQVPDLRALLPAAGIADSVGVLQDRIQELRQNGIGSALEAVGNPFLDQIKESRKQMAGLTASAAAMSELGIVAEDRRMLDSALSHDLWCEPELKLPEFPVLNIENVGNAQYEATLRIESHLAESSRALTESGRREERLETELRRVREIAEAADQRAVCAEQSKRKWQIVGLVVAGLGILASILF